MEKNFAQCFSTNTGAQVLKHLRSITIERYLGPNATEAQLRSLEAQRALVHQILNLVERGKNANKP
ncbi:MAG: hypothetical protein FWD33_02470 [Alphaproteobacteria bacterium]|nr:hypothetical protein [Alphaproteobacteria bacterium]